MRDVTYATNIVHAVCCIAGSASFVDDLRVALRQQGINQAVKNHDTPALFGWLMEMLSYQGISDRLAAGYIDRHGTVSWTDITNALARQPACEKLGGYWLFHDCGYQKTSGTCAEPNHISTCPLPHHALRNGRLNQTAYSLFLFLRDVADGDLVNWIDEQLLGVTRICGRHPVPLRDAVIGPLRNVYGIGDKVLAMALSSLLMGTRKRGGLWYNVGADLVAIDTLVHNFLHRTGILRRLSANHAYGPACYAAGGCASIIRSVSAEIDASQFNSKFPTFFPRFVQSSIWSFCAQNGLGICNGNRVDDNARCDNTHCQLFRSCDRVVLRAIIA